MIAINYLLSSSLAPQKSATFLMAADYQTQIRDRTKLQHHKSNYTARRNSSQRKFGSGKNSSTQNLQRDAQFATHHAQSNSPHHYACPTFKKRNSNRLTSMRRHQFVMRETMFICSDSAEMTSSYFVRLLLTVVDTELTPWVIARARDG